MDTISSTVFEGFSENIEKQISMLLMNHYNVKNPTLVIDPIDKVDTTMFQEKSLKTPHLHNC